MLALYWGVNTSYILIGLGLILVLSVVLGVQAHRERVRGGNEELPGMAGEVTRATDAHGMAYALVRSEIWRVHCAQSLSVGDAVKVQAAHGLTLEVVRTGGVGDGPNPQNWGTT